MKNYIKYLVAVVALVLFVIPFGVHADEVTNVFIDKEDKLSFTGVEGYNVYQVYIKYNDTTIYEFGQNSGGKSASLFEKIIETCNEHEGVCPNDYVGNYTLEIVALDTANEYAQVDSTRTTKTISFKKQFFNGENYFHADIVGNETKFTVTLDPDNDIDDPQEMTNLTFGQHVQLGTIESYGFTKLPKRVYYGWELGGDFYVIQDVTIEPVWEPLFTMSFNFNGGTLNGLGTFSKDGVGYAPSLSLDNVLSAFGETNNVVPPYGKEIDYVTINGVQKAIDPEDGFMFSQDTEIVYYWKWSEGVEHHTVTFTDGYDNVISTVEVADGQPVARPVNPTLGNLLFCSWQVNGSDYNFTTAVTNDLTIEAYWNFNFRVEANVNGAAIFTYNGLDYNNSVGSAGVYHENEILGVDQRGINGYELVEWRLGDTTGPVIGNDSNADYYIANGGHLKLKQKTNTSNLVFVAIYQKTKVAVNFVTNGGTAINTQYVTPGEYAAKPGLHDSTKEGYILGKWYTDPELTHEFNFFTPIQTETTLYASWNIYLSEVDGVVDKPVAGFRPDTTINSLDSTKYTFSLDYWYLTENGFPHIEGDDTFVLDKEYEVRFHVVPAEGYGVDENTVYKMNNENTSCFGSSVDRQIRWVATAPTEVSTFSLSGVVAPLSGNTFNNANLRINTEGLSAEQFYWTEEGTGKVLKSTDKFELGKRYILHVEFTKDYGYVFVEGYDESALTGPTGYLKAELVNNVDVLDMQIFYEAKKVPLSTPVLKLSVVNNAATLTFNNSGQKYEIYRSTDNKNWKKIKDLTTLTYTNKSLTYGTTYYYKVRAGDGKKWSSYSNVVKKKIVPAKVANLTITSAGTNNIKIKYDKVSTTGYEVYMGTKTSKMNLVKDITSNSTLTYNKTGLKANTKYYFKVRAYKTVSGKKVYGKWSAIVSTKTAPLKPTLKLTLKSLDSMNVAIGKASGATKYDLQMGTDGKSYRMGEILPKYGTYAHSGLEVGKTYYFRVRACNSENRCSSWVKASLLHTTKAPAFSLATTSKKVTVTLKTVTGADGYEIARATVKDGKYTTVKKLSSTAGLEFVDTTKKATTYYYKVRSYKTVGTKKIYSPYSSIKTIVSK